MAAASISADIRIHACNAVDPAEETKSSYFTIAQFLPPLAIARHTTTSVVDTLSEDGVHPAQKTTDTVRAKL